MMIDKVKWCIRLLLLISFFSGLALYYVVIDKLDQELTFLDGDDN